MSTTLTTLLAQVRDYIDEPTADRWTDAELTRYINQGMRQVQSTIESANSDYFLRVEVATASAGSSELALPADIYGTRLRALFHYPQSTVATGQAYRMEPLPLENVYKNMHSSGTPEGYCLHAGYLRWAPMLQYAGAFRFIYSMKETALSDGADIIGQIADEHTDCIALYAAIMAIGKVGGNIAHLQGMYNTRMQQIKWDVQPTNPLRIPQVGIDD